jgi:SpoIID/LytB domain protein
MGVVRVLLAAALLALSAPFGAPGLRGGTASLVPVLRIDGRGFGHGVGLQEDGAYAMGEAGASMLQILGQFYPGTELARVPDVPVRVVVLRTGPEATVSFPSGGQVQAGTGGPEPPGFPVAVPPGGEVTISTDGTTYVATTSSDYATTTSSDPSATTTAASPVGTRAATAIDVSEDSRPDPGFAGSGAPSPVRVTTPSPVPSPAPPTTTTTLPPAGAGSGPSPTTSSTAPPATAPPATAPPATSPSTTSPSTTSPSTTSPSTTSPSPDTTAPATVSASEVGTPLWAVPSAGGVVGVPETGREYLGALEAEALGPGELELVNELPVEQYLEGMGEVLDPAWPEAALEAQAVVERTYALRAMETAGELCDTTRCQVYLGEQAAYPAMDAAIAATSGLVLVYDGELAATVYSANGGGITATPEEGFGTSNAPFPYLRAAPYPTLDPDPWTVVVSLADAAQRLGYPGRLERVSVAERGPSGRALAVSLDGSAGPRTVSGLAFAADLGLRSTLLTSLGIGAAPGAPPPPPPSNPGQALPTDRAAIAAAAAQPTARSVTHDPARSSGLARRRSPGVPAGLWAAALVVFVASLGALVASRWDALVARLDRSASAAVPGRAAAPGEPGAASRT